MRSILHSFPFLILVFVPALALISCGGNSSSSSMDGGTLEDSGPKMDAAVDGFAPDEFGSFSVGHMKFTAIDADRDDRSLVIDVWYPVDEADAPDLSSPETEFASYTLTGPLAIRSEFAVENLPVSSRTDQVFLVFSHGYGGTNTQSIPLMETLASHGFIIASPEHTGNTALDRTDDQPTAASRRVPDVSFVIDTFFKRNTTVDDAFENRFDTSNTGVLGHSFGGTTSIGMITSWADGPTDPRVKAIFPIAGGVRTFDAEELAAIDVPVFLLGGTEDESAIANNIFGFAEMTAAPNLFKVEIEGATHTHFANICAIGDYLIDIGFAMDAWPGLGAGALLAPYAESCSPDAFPVDEAHRIQNLYAVSFFKRFLLREKRYDQFLTTSYAEANESAVDFVSKSAE